MSKTALHLANLAWLALVGCAQPPAKPQEPPKEKPPQVAKVKVSDSCQRAVDRQVSNSGFALVVNAGDVLSRVNLEELDRLYRKIHGIPGVESVRGIGDEQVVVTSELQVEVEPFLDGTGDNDPGLRVQRYSRFHQIIDPVLLSRDQGTTALLVGLLPTSKKEARTDIHDKISRLLEESKAKMRMNLIEYPVVARESLRWLNKRSLEALDALNRDLAGGGLLEVTVSCRRSDCLMDPAHLSAIERFLGIVETMPRVRATRSVITIIRAVNRAKTGHDALPASADRALGLMALLDRTSGVRLYVDERNRRGVIRLYFETGTAADYCTLGKAIKKATKESSSETLRFKVRRPGRKGL